MGRRGGGGMRRAPAPAPRQTMPAQRPAQPPAAAQPQQRQPGLMGQMASTAAGVAIGSTVGHAIGGALFGHGGGQAPAEQQQVAPEYQTQQQPWAGRTGQPGCQFELEQFLQCSQNQTDISLCSQFNDALKSCRLQYGP